VFYAQWWVSKGEEDCRAEVTVTSALRMQGSDAGGRQVQPGSFVQAMNLPTPPTVTPGTDMKTEVSANG
jgi:hypothetical protein